MPSLVRQIGLWKMTTTDPYSVLGLSPGASDKEIRQAYFRLVREHPPETDPATFKVIRAAYERLRTAQDRAVADLFLLQPPPPWSPKKRAPRLDLSFHPQDVLVAAKAFSDLGRDDFQADFREPEI